MRRTIVGLLFSLAYACACIAIAGFLLQRTAFDPDNTADAADVVLQDGPIRAALSSAIAEAATPAVAANPWRSITSCISVTVCVTATFAFIAANSIWSWKPRTAIWFSSR